MRIYTETDKCQIVFQKRHVKSVPGTKVRIEEDLNLDTILKYLPRDIDRGDN